MKLIRFVVATSAAVMLASCGTFHDRLGDLYPTFYETTPASSAYKPGRIYSEIEILDPVTRNGLERVAFNSHCRPRVESEENTTFSETFVEDFNTNAQADVEIAGIAELKNDDDIVSVVRSVTMTINATHLVIDAESISAAQAIARDVCPATLRRGQMITQAILADVEVEIELQEGVNVTAATTARALREITGRIGFGISRSSTTTTSASGVIVAVKLEDANRPV